MQRFAAVLAVCVADGATAPKTLTADSDSASFLQSSRSSNEAPKKERYGPGGCVSTWRDGTSGHCMMETDCPESEDLGTYEFGLLCAGEGGEVTRHVFGQDSFLHRETFDTLIECEECLALDEYMDAGAAVTTLAKQVNVLTSGMKNVTESIARLEAAVGGPAAAPAPAPVAAAPANFVAQRRPAQKRVKHAAAKHVAAKPVAAKRPAAKHLAKRAAAKPASHHVAAASSAHRALAHHSDRSAREVVDRKVAGKHHHNKDQDDEDAQADTQEDGAAQESDQEEEGEVGEEDGQNYFQQENQNNVGDAEDEDEERSDDEAPADNAADGAADSDRDA